jgi:hypothetical protein
MRKEGSMPRRIRVGHVAGIRFDEMQAVMANPVVLAGSCFVLGLAMGMMLKDAARQVYERARNNVWHRDYDRTVEYDENLPDSLGRREPAPDSGQPRFGGTGALGVSPAVVRTPRPEENQ